MKSVKSFSKNGFLNFYSAGKSSYIYNAAADKNFSVSGF